MEIQSYFLTVDWCKKGDRGIFCDTDGRCFRKDGEPHTELEMGEILGPFELILAPESQALTAQQVSEFNQFTPLAEYSYEFGIARKCGG